MVAGTCKNQARNSAERGAATAHPLVFHAYSQSFPSPRLPATSSLAILAITALHPFTVNFTAFHRHPPPAPDHNQAAPSINDFIMLTPREPFEFDSEAGSSDDASQ